MWPHAYRGAGFREGWWGPAMVVGLPLVCESVHCPCLLHSRCVVWVSGTPRWCGGPSHSRLWRRRCGGVVARGGVLRVRSGHDALRGCVIGCGGGDGQARDWFRVAHLAVWLRAPRVRVLVVSSCRCRSLPPEGGAVMWCEWGTWWLGSGVPSGWAGFGPDVLLPAVGGGLSRGR